MHTSDAASHPPFGDVEVVLQQFTVGVGISPTRILMRETVHRVADLLW